MQTRFESEKQWVSGAQFLTRVLNLDGQLELSNER